MNEDLFTMLKLTNLGIIATYLDDGDQYTGFKARKIKPDLYIL